jgi:AcrR family transcriptional regulator
MRQAATTSTADLLYFSRKMFLCLKIKPSRASRNLRNHVAGFCFRVYTVYMKARPTIEKILIAARRLLDKEGAEAVTMRRVADAAGITAMAIYRHFSDRSSLLNAVADQGFAELAAELARRRFSGSIEKRLTRMGEIYLDHALENPRLFELMFLKPREGARRYPRDFKAGLSPTANLMLDAVKEGMESGHFRKDDAWEIVFEIGALSHGLIMLYLGGRMDVTPAGFRALYKRSFRRYIDGIRK